MEAENFRFVLNFGLAANQDKYQKSK